MASAGAEDLRGSEKGCIRQSYRENLDDGEWPGEEKDDTCNRHVLSSKVTANAVAR